MSKQRSNARTKSVQSILCVDSDGESIGILEFVEFMISNESVIVLMVVTKIDDDLSEKFATKYSVWFEFNASILLFATCSLLVFPIFHDFFFRFICKWLPQSFCTVINPVVYSFLIEKNHPGTFLYLSYFQFDVAVILWMYFWCASQKPLEDLFIAFPRCNSAVE